MEKLFFDLYTTGNNTKKFFPSRLIVKSISIHQRGPPLYLKEEDQAIKFHPYIEKFVRTKKIKFPRYRKVAIIFDPIQESETYYNVTAKALQFKGQPLCQRASTSAMAGPSNQNSHIGTRSSGRLSVANTHSSASKSRKRKSSVAIKNDKFSPLEEQKTKKIVVQKEVFNIESYMIQRGFKKFDHNKMDLYRFLDAFETGAAKMKYDDRQKLTSFLFFLEEIEESTYLTIRSHQSPADWEEFKEIFIDYYHKTIYDRSYKYLSAKYVDGSIATFAQKKVEVLRYFLKTIPTIDLIQMVSWTLPEECQRTIMPMLCSTLDSFYEAIQDYENEEEEKEGEDTENPAGQNDNENDASLSSQS